MARGRFRSPGSKVLTARAPQLTNVALEAVSELVVDFHLLFHGLREKGLCLVERRIEHILRHAVVRDVEETGSDSSLLKSRKERARGVESGRSERTEVDGSAAIASQPHLLDLRALDSQL